VLYTGVTNDLMRRMYEHKNKLLKGFASKYNLIKLVYFKDFPSAYEAICAEKVIKGWLIIKKIKLIKSTNPSFDDLSKDWY